MVGRSSPMQYNDYWTMLGHTMGEDGGWRIGGLFEAHNEHVIVVPKVLYWLNAVVFDGSNRTLGTVVVAIALGQVALLALMARRTRGLDRWSRVALVIAAAVLLISNWGGWSFIKAMSGTAWLTANLFAIAALVAQDRGRRFLAPGLAIVASLSYGTGLAAWPALIVAAAARDGRSVRRQWPTAVAAAAVLGWYLLWFRSSDGSAKQRDPVGLLGGIVERIGWPVAGEGSATVAGAVCLVALAAAAAWSLRTRRTAIAASPWLGLAAYGVSACFLIVVARNELFLTGTPTSRYVSLGAVTIVATLALVLMALPRRWWRSLMVAPLVLVVWSGGGGVLDDLDRTTRQHDLLGVAVRLGVADGQKPPGWFQDFPPLTEPLRERGHVPFDRESWFDCGLMGSKVPTSDGLPSPVVGATSADIATRWPSTVSHTGQLDLGGATLDCIVVLDDEGLVVGAGRHWVDEGTGRFETLARAGTDLVVHARVSGDERFHPVPIRS